MPPLWCGSIPVSQSRIWAAALQSEENVVVDGFKPNKDHLRAQQASIMVRMGLPVSVPPVHIGEETVLFYKIIAELRELSELKADPSPSKLFSVAINSAVSDN